MASRQMLCVRRRLTRRCDRLRLAASQRGSWLFVRGRSMTARPLGRRTCVPAPLHARCGDGALGRRRRHARGHVNLSPRGRCCRRVRRGRPRRRRASRSRSRSRSMWLAHRLRCRARSGLWCRKRLGNRDRRRRCRHRDRGRRCVRESGSCEIPAGSQRCESCRATHKKAKSLCHFVTMKMLCPSISPYLF